MTELPNCRPANLKIIIIIICVYIYFCGFFLLLLCNFYTKPKTGSRLRENTEAFQQRFGLFLPHELKTAFLLFPHGGNQLRYSSGTEDVYVYAPRLVAGGPGGRTSGKAACVFTSGACQLPLRPSGSATAARHGALRRNQKPPDECLEKECEVSAHLSGFLTSSSSPESSEPARSSHVPAASCSFAYLRRCID